MVLCPVIKASIEEVQDLDATDRGREDSVQQVFKNKFLPLIIKNIQNKLFLKNLVLLDKKIFSSKILIIGMGGLGCPLSIYLASWA